MVVIDNIGEVSTFTDGVQWMIPNFYRFPQKHGTVIRSPYIRFADRGWHINAYTDGSGWFGISVFDRKRDDSMYPSILISIAGGTERNFVKFRAEYNGKGMYGRKIFPSDFLKSWRNIMVPGGDLYVNFDVENDTNAASINAQWIQLVRGNVEEWIQEESEKSCVENSTQTEKENVEKWCEEKLENACVEACTQTEDEYGKENTNEKHDKAYKDTFTQTKEEIDIGIENQSFKDIFLKGNISDVVLKVRDKEFRDHKCILATRSPAFVAVIMQDTKEQVTRVVDIQDIDQSTFPDFLKYLYTGCVENMTSENALKLCTIADKYQVNELKENCLNHLLENISIGNFCDVFTLSLRYDKKDLKEACIQFFSENSLEIIVTPKWQVFLRDNPKAGNELFIKHLQLNAL